MNKWIGFFLRALLALFIGGCLALLILQRDERFKHSTEEQIKTFFVSSYGADISCRVVSINLLRPSITLESVVVTPTDSSDHAWRWTARRGIVSSSWFTALLTRAMPISVAIEDARADSIVVQQKPAILEHLNRLFAFPEVGIPVFLKKIQIYKSFLRIKSEQSEIVCSLQAELARAGSTTKVSLSPTEGTIIYQRTPYARDVQGTIRMEFGDGASPYAHVSLTGNFPILAPEKTNCFLYGTWQQGKGTFSFHNSDRSCLIDPLIIDAEHNVDVVVSLPVACMQALTMGKAGAASCSGSCSAHVVTNLQNPVSSLRADCSLRNTRIKGISLPTTQLVLSADHGKQSGIVDIQMPDGTFTGTWRLDMQKGGSLAITNNSVMRAPFSRYWKVVPEQLTVKAAIDMHGTTTIATECTLTHERLGTTVRGKGSVSIKDHTLKGSAFFGEKKVRIDVVADLAQRLLTHAAYHDAIGTCRAKLDIVGSGNGWKGFFDYALIPQLLPQRIRDELNGQGIFNLELVRSNRSPLITGSISLQQGAIKLPQLYNFITAISAGVVVDPANRMLAINDFNLQFNRGAIHSKRLTCYANERYVPSFIYAPLVIEDLFVSWHHDIFGMLSGALTLKVEDQPHVSGVLFVDKAHTNISNIFNQQVFSAPAPAAAVPVQDDVQLDVSIKTRGPCTIQTGVIDATAKADLTVGGQLHQPVVSGNVQLISGELKFPYKPLHITHGRLDFLPNQMYDPLIELTGKNKIKKYQVTVQVNGSAQNPHIHVEADPTLTEEQVLALLFAGVEDSSLNVLMPTLVTQGMQQAVLGQTKQIQPTSKLANYFKAWLKPLAHVRIVPRFNDEGGRGGLRGAIEIEVSENLEAVIEKNFSLPEDTKINVDYSISDDISIRGIKDERGDLGGEMEVRWKF